MPRSCNVLLVRVTVAITPQFSTGDPLSRIVLVREDCGLLTSIPALTCARFIPDLVRVN